jgi:hypothetical protein
MEKRFTARSNSLGDFDVTLSITEKNAISTTIKIKEQIFNCRFIMIQGKPAVEIGPMAIKALGRKEKVAQIVLTEPYKEALAKFEAEATSRLAAAKAAEIASLIESGKVVYLLMQGGDSKKYSIGIGHEVPADGYNESVRLFRVIESTDVRDGIANADWNGNCTVSGFYGDVAIISKEQYGAAVNAKAQKQEAVKAEQSKNSEANKVKFTEAAQTGNPVFLYRVTDFMPCKEEGCADHYDYYAMPDGTTKEERIHTY